MKKHPKMPSVVASPVCTFTNEILEQPLQISPFAFKRYLRKRALIKSSQSLKTYALPCGCFVWVYSSGIRELSALPF